jgi:hypothetical protein
MKGDPYWFFKKWGIPEEGSIEDRYDLLEKKYSDLLLDVKRLEEENIETSNVLYEIMNSLEAIDRRIDILFEKSIGD